MGQLLTVIQRYTGPPYMLYVRHGSRVPQTDATYVPAIAYRT